ncbi:MAG: hypothetical protein KDD38_08605 [Bdellovibrionales bacterium]|nr:hypothetical protein [Bdellovibrionales bacterium]
MKRLLIYVFTTLTTTLLTLACSTTPKQGAEISSRMDTSAYKNLIQENTRHAIDYEGFYNKFEIYATFINTDVQTAILQRRSDSLQWDTRKAQSEREKLFQESATQTHFAVSFYVPSVRLNDLHKGNSIWKIYLVSGGERYEGRATKQNGKLEDLLAIYPYHNRWSIAYEVTFNIPLSAVEGKPATLIITSTQGTAELQF